MNCPKCDRYTPDESFKCLNCGAIIRIVKNEYESQPDQPFSSPFRNRKVTTILAVAAVLVIGFLVVQGIGKGGSHAVNAGAPGEETDISTLAQKGKTTIFDFYSDYCPPCRKISPLLQKLDDQREDIVVVKLDINRKDAKGIDWASPLARQYNLRSIPYFVIYDAAGEKIADGQDAAQQVFSFLTKANIQ
jgi:thiol-disulfide isomerase/thioredoxin